MTIFYTTAILVVTWLVVAWFFFGGTEWLMWKVADAVRLAVRRAKDSDEAETWAARYRNAVEEGLRDRDVERIRRGGS